MRYPRRSSEHAVGDRAVERFRIDLPRDWAKNEVMKDYGWDIWVTITKNEQVRESFFVQLKGSDQPNYTDRGAQISISLSVSTVNWLLDMSSPVMVCLCDTGKAEEPVYYVWLQEEINGTAKRNPIWRNQRSITIHIPTSQRTDKAGIQQIQEYVEKFYMELKINTAIGNMLSPSFGFKKSTPLTVFAESASEAVVGRMPAAIADSGIIDIVDERGKQRIEPLSSKDRKRFFEIKKSSFALSSFRDKEAEEILDRLKSEIEKASDGIRARYHNNFGVLALHQGKLKNGKENFKQALLLRPSEPKYQTNVLTAEFLLSLHQKPKGPLKLGRDWTERLDKTMKDNPDFTPALRLRAEWLRVTQGARVAEVYLRDTKAWRDDPVCCLCGLSNAFKSEGNLNKAIELLSEAEKIGKDLNGMFWNSYGTTLLLRAMGVDGREERVDFCGPGPSLLDVETLRKSEQCLSRACESFSNNGFPYISEMAIVNFAIVQRILGKTDDAKHFCKGFLREHHDDPHVAEALALCSIAEDDFPSAVEYSKIAFEANPSDRTGYQNYIISLYQTEDYDELLRITSERSKTGFSDKREEGLSLSFSAIALNEIGEVEKSAEIVSRMRDDPSFCEDATIAQAIVKQKNGTSDEETATMFRQAMEKCPSTMFMLTHFQSYLSSSKPIEALEKAEVIEKLSGLRQLLASEINSLGLCYITLGHYEKAVSIFENGEKRYPFESRLLYGHARALSALGDEEGTYNVLKQYVNLGKRDSNVLRNLAFSALETGRLDEAVSIFQKALSKAKDDDVRGELHCQLWELKRKGEAIPKDLLRHVIGFGSTFKNDPEKEARFLMMALLSPFPEKMDECLNNWIEGIKIRLKRFSEEHPKFPYFMSFKIPKDIPEGEKGAHILGKITEVMFPSFFASEPFKVAIRSAPFPFSLRAQYLPEVNSIFEYWSKCVTSRNYSNGIHILLDQNPLDVETKESTRGEKVCADINTLLCLAELDLLDLLSKRFEQIILARGTKRAIDYEIFRTGGGHSLAEKIDKWRIDNRIIIRVRSAKSEKKNVNRKLGLILDADGNHEATDKVFGYGVGESILLARDLGVHLYSDDGYIRYYAHTEYGVKCFSTISLVRKLRTEGSLRLESETSVYCELLLKNFRIIPFNKDHLNSRLDALILTAKSMGLNCPNRELLMSDCYMGVLLRQFGDTFYKEKWLAHIMVSWWISLLEIEELDQEVLIKAMEYPAYALSMRATGRVLMPHKGDEQVEILGHVLSFFLLSSYECESRHVGRAWSAIKSCAEGIFQNDHEKYDMTLFSALPAWLLKETVKLKGDWLSKLMMIIHLLPEEDRKRIDSTLIEMLPRLIGDN